MRGLAKNIFSSVTAIFIFKGHTNFLFPVNVRTTNTHTGKPDYRGWAHMDKSRRGAKQSHPEWNWHWDPYKTVRWAIIWFGLLFAQLHEQPAQITGDLTSAELSDCEQSALWVKHGWQRWTRSRSGGGEGQRHGNPRIKTITRTAYWFTLGLSSNAYIKALNSPSQE